MQSRSSRLVRVLLALSAVTLAVVVVAWRVATRYRAGSGRVPCGSNLRQIGQAARMYAINLDGSYPPDLETLYYSTAGLGPDLFVCPEDDGAAPAPPPFVPGRNLSYTYLGGGLSEGTTDYHDVLAHCSPAHHGEDGTHILFADGSVRYVYGDELRRLLPSLAQPTQR